MQNHGRWSEPGVPHKGWYCEGVEDLEDERRICEMCLKQEIRFVHYMAHVLFSEVLACGCDCAGRMEENDQRASQRDKSMRSAASKRTRFPSLKKWKTSAKGNPIVRHEGARITIFATGRGFKYVVTPPFQIAERFSRQIYATIRAAQLGAFDEMTHLQAEIEEKRKAFRARPFNNFSSGV